MFLTEDHVYLLIRLDPRPFRRTDTFQSREEDALHAAASVTHTHTNTRTLSSSAVLVLTRVCGEMLSEFHIAEKWALWSVSSLKTSALTLCFSWAPAMLKEVSWQAGQVWKTMTASEERHRDRQTERQTGGYATLPAAPLFMNRLSGCCDAQTLFTCSACAFLLWAFFTSDKTTSKPQKTC